MLNKILHAFMQRLLVRVPEVKRFTLSILAISARKFEDAPGDVKGRIKGHGAAPS